MPGETHFIHTEASKALRRKRVSLHRARRRRDVHFLSVLVTAEAVAGGACRRERKRLEVTQIFRSVVRFRLFARQSQHAKPLHVFDGRGVTFVLKFQRFADFSFVFLLACKNILRDAMIPISHGISPLIAWGLSQASRVDSNKSTN